ncbi:hypothetical protein NDU88_010961 [Pleurodeles waltl]|uniref:Uncharacterized protein n=1 Tax=Pleurodeles waltl TaxID=8319 RepID=A0AAV7S5J4_PLEWA|nr:hypothetical protein NDU88_010961 [Pleurodeles waltl]
MAPVGVKPDILSGKPPKLVGLKPTKVRGLGRFPSLQGSESQVRRGSHQEPPVNRPERGPGPDRNGAVLRKQRSTEVRKSWEEVLVAGKDSGPQAPLELRAAGCRRGECSPGFPPRAAAHLRVNPSGGL